jgi:ribonuclease VapC
MIAVDTSALMAIILGEPEGDACIAALMAQDDIVISVGTVAESLIVSR